MWVRPIKVGCLTWLQTGGPGHKQNFAKVSYATANERVISATPGSNLTPRRAFAFYRLA